MKRLKSAISFLLGEVTREGLIAVDALEAFLRLVTHIAVKMIAFIRLACELNLRFGVVVHGAILAWCLRNDILSSDVELAKLPQVINQQVIKSYGLLGLLKCVLMSVDLGQNCTKLHLESRNDI